MVVVSGLSGLTNAYTSVLSYWGVPEISGASRWLEAEAAPGCSAVTPAAASAPAASAPHTRVARVLRPPPLLEIGVMPSVLMSNLPDARHSERWWGRIGRISNAFATPVSRRRRTARRRTRVFGFLIRNPSGET